MTATLVALDDAIAAVGGAWPAAGEALVRLVSVPGVSAEAYPARDVRRSAEATAEALLDFGATGVRILETGGHPAVFGEFEAEREAPCVLVYGHHDVQPPGRDDAWLSPPFAAEIRDGRVFGRGTADDKGGVLAYLTAASAWMEAGGPPCRVKFLVEGEEEIGSPHLGSLLLRHRDDLACDAAILCDTPNFDQGVPALTYRLRGNSVVDVEVSCLERPVHSGQAGGWVPDALLILCQILARVQRPDGTLNVPGLAERVRVGDAERAALRAMPCDEDRLRERFGVLDGVSTVEGASSPYERLWAEPSLTVTALDATPLASAGNVIADVARARLSLRTVRDLSVAEAGRLLASALEDDPPRGARVTTSFRGGPEWWEADTTHPLFAVARKALSRGFGRPAVLAGSGGSIGFVRAFADLMGDRPLLLTGVQDPSSNAHAENESLHLGDWRRAMDAAVYLFHDLAAALGAAA